ncbi:MAG TPA: hypothetical protein VGO70_11380 [Arsenicitalea sp.]|nr:hypothetical protein [Arsenicitalea sp.]
MAQLAPLPETPQRSRLALAVSAKPWPGDVVVTNEATGSAVARAVGTAMLGELVDALAGGPIAVWDAGNVLTLELYSGHLASADDPAVLAGSNRLAIETDAGAWEIVGFADAELVSPNTYRLTRLLRGLDGSSDAVGAASAGNRVMVLYDRVVTAPVPSEWLGDTLALKAYSILTVPNSRSRPRSGRPCRSRRCTSAQRADQAPKSPSAGSGAAGPTPMPGLLPTLRSTLPRKPIG